MSPTYPDAEASSFDLVNVELRTERLILRPVRDEDLDGLVEIHADPVTQEIFGVVDRDDVVRWIAQARGEWAERGQGRLVLIDRESGAFLGRSGLRYWPQFEEVEVGWILHPAARGRGLATEAGRASLDWGFRELDVDYLTAMIAPDNAASIAVAERLGMEPLREDVLHGAQVIVYAAWRNRPGERDSDRVGR